MDILAKREKNTRCVHLEVGEPDIPAVAARQGSVHPCRFAMNRFFYTPVMRIWELRKRLLSTISGLRRETYRRHERFIVTTGTSGAFLIVFSRLRECGMRMILCRSFVSVYTEFCVLTPESRAGICHGWQRNELRDRFTSGSVRQRMPVRSWYPLRQIRPATSTSAGLSTILISVMRKKRCVLCRRKSIHGLVVRFARSIRALEIPDDAIGINIIFQGVSACRACASAG